MMSLAVFVVSAATYLLLRSHDMMAVDGAIRAFMVYRKPLEITVNPHMFYQLWVWLWSHAFGLNSRGPQEYFRAVQAMNCVAAALCATVLFRLIYRFTSSGRVAIIGTMAWAFAHVVVLHATNAAEPMSGLLWSVAALALTLNGLRRDRYWPLALAGLMLAIAMASYRSMVFMGLACGLVALLWPASGVREAVGRATVLSAAFLACVLVIFGIVAWREGARSVHAATQMLTQVDAEGVYLGITPTKIVNSVVGYANAFVCAVPTDYAGLRALRSHVWRAWLVVSVLVVVGASVFLLRKVILERDRERLALYAGCGAAFLLGILLLWSWDPIYHKLWLQPLWLVVLMGSVASTNLHHRTPLAALVFMFVAVNIAISAKAARGPWPGVDEAQRVSSIVGANDLVVGGWSSVAVIFRNVYASGSQSLDFPFEASTTGKHSLETLRSRIEHTKSAGGRVYFLDLFDQNAAAWNAFLGDRCGVPYESVADYRAKSVPVGYFASNGTTITLRVLR